MWIASTSAPSSPRIDARSCDGGPAATEVVPSRSTTSSGRPSATVPWTTERAPRRRQAELGERRRVRRASRRDRNVARRDATGRLGDPALVEPSLAHRGDDRRPDARDVPLVDVVPEAERVGAREQRLHGALLHPHGRAHRLHLERVGDDRAGEPELVAQQPGELGAAERCRHVVDRRDDEVGRHDRAGAGGDRRPERRELDLQQLLARRRDDGQSEVRVDVGRAVAGKVLRAGGDPTRLEPGHERGDMAGDQRRVGAERADADHGVERVDVDVGDRSEIQRDAGRAELVGEGAGDLLGERDVVDRAEREGAGQRAAAARPRAG